MEKAWKFFACPQTLLNLDIVLNCGQCFRWSKTESGEWIGVIGKRLWILKQDQDQVFYKSIGTDRDSSVAASEENGRIKKVSTKSRTRPACDVECSIQSLKKDNEESFLKDYFQLNVDLDSLYKVWSKNDQVFSKLSQNFGGLRMLRQDPVENLFSFICSQNNHISRISAMVEKLCTNYGEMIHESGEKSYFAFPSINALSDDKVEENLRKLGFGYRAKFINQCAKKILADGGDDWLCNLRKVPYKEAHSALCQLPGVGAKVADCVCLMSLDKTEAIPVDTHMWQIAQRDYLPHLKKYKSLTDKIYQEIGDHFRSMYGDFAGWAHSVLFSADLRRFRELKEDALKPLVIKKAKVSQIKAPKIEPFEQAKSLDMVDKVKVLKRRSSKKEMPQRAVKQKKAY